MANSAFITGVGSGAILQVVSTTKTDSFSTTSTSMTDITGMSVSITPSSTNSKIYIIATLNCQNSGDNGGINLVRDSTAIAQPTSFGSRTAMTAITNRNANGTEGETKCLSFLDSPSTTSATTYKLQMYVRSGTGYVNRSSTDTNSAVYPRGVSTITVMEVAG